MSSGPLVIVDGLRSPFTRMGTALAGTPADELGRQVLRALLDRTGLDPATVDEVIIGCVGPPVDTPNIARVIALRAGVPLQVPALTLCRNCASGADALLAAEEKMLAGKGAVFLVGGVESMSRYPLLYPESARAKFSGLQRARGTTAKLKALLAFRPADFAPVVALKCGLTDPVCGLGMGETAELIGREYGVSREEQDAYAARSHLRARAAHEHLAEEISPVFSLPDYRRVEEDVGPREDSTPEALAKLKPAFDRIAGTVTPGNASQLTDGAVMLLVMSAEEAERRGLEPLGILRGGVVRGCDPARMGLGPAYAIAAAEKSLGLSLADADRIELNEAFAAQVLACVRACASDEFGLGEIPEDRLNVNGGSIALGHPLGATGARLILTALLELKRSRLRRALVTACVGGGQGIALWLERP